MKNKKVDKKVWAVRIFCGFLALMMIIGVVYTAIAYL